jgi:hypothetical protein
VGPPLATLLSVSGYNAVSIALVWFKFQLFPFTGQTLKAIGFALVAFLLANLIPVSGYELLDLMLRSGFFALVFGVLVLRFRVSEDLNGLVRMLWGKVGR